MGRRGDVVTAAESRPRLPPAESLAKEGGFWKTSLSGEVMAKVSRSKPPLSLERSRAVLGSRFEYRTESSVELSMEEHISPCLSTEKKNRRT